MQEMRRQSVKNHFDIYSDSDHAGCRRTRGSTTGMVVMHGCHLIEASSSTQKVVSLSSGESEFYAALKASAEGLGLLSMMKDFGWTATG